MRTHYQVLGIAMEATTEDITNAYRKAVFDVLPKHNLFPTSVLAIDKFRVVQDAYECLIKPEIRTEYDAGLRELAAEEQSLFGERKARRQSKDEAEQKKKKASPPYVWNEDTNAPLFWTPGPKLIEGPKTDPEATPVAYFKRSSLDKQLAKVSTEVVPVQKSVTATPSPQKSAHRRIQSSPVGALVTRTPLPQEVAKAKVRPAVSSQAEYFYEQPQYSPPQSQFVHGWQYSVVAADYLAQQQAQMQAVEERHRQLVENERAKLLHDLEKRKRAVERERRQKIQVEEEVRRRLAEKEEEMAAKYAERMRAKEEIEKENERLRIKAEKKKAKRASAKQVRWGVGDAGFEEAAPVAEYNNLETGPGYGSGWWSEPELPRVRHNVLKKRRVYT